MSSTGILRPLGARAHRSAAAAATWSIGVVSLLGFAAGRAAASVTPQWVPVPISADAIAADPNLANFRTYDLQVTQSGGEHWVGTDLRVSLEAGKFYVPPSGDQRWAKSNLWAASPNLEFDTFITSPDSLASPNANDGTPLPGSHLVVLGEASYPTLGTPGAPGTMPDAANDRTRVDIAYGDLYAMQSPFGDGTYIVARLTLSNDAAADVGGRVMGNYINSGTVNNLYYPPVLRISPVPEPTMLGTVGLLGTGALLLRRWRRCPRADWPGGNSSAHDRKDRR